VTITGVDFSKILWGGQSTIFGEKWYQKRGRFSIVWGTCPGCHPKVYAYGDYRWTVDWLSVTDLFTCLLTK